MEHTTDATEAPWVPQGGVRPIQDPYVSRQDAEHIWSAQCAQSWPWGLSLEPFAPHDDGARSDSVVATLSLLHAKDTDLLPQAIGRPTTLGRGCKVHCCGSSAVSPELGPFCPPALPAWVHRPTPVSLTWPLVPTLPAYTTASRRRGTVFTCLSMGCPRTPSTLSSASSACPRGFR